MVRVRLPLGAILLALCSLALASSGGDTPPHGDNGAATFQQWRQSNVAPSSSSFLRRQESIAAIAARSFPPRVLPLANSHPPQAGGMDSRLRGNDGIMGGLDSRLRGNDGLIAGGLLAIANDGNFADFYRQQQARLLTAIDDTIATQAATQAEKAITDNFAAVKRAGVQVQTKLGERKGNFGVDIVGAFAESDNFAAGWQVRGYAGDDSTKGANAGVFYRVFNGDMLFGANAFADYEDGDYGEFSRYSIGGELAHKWFGFNANYYLPITDDKRINATVAAFSRRGYDAQLRINAPNNDRLKAAVDYYAFDGKRGTAKDSGIRFGAEIHPAPAVQFGLYYDENAEEFYGDVRFAYTIGEAQARQNTDTFAPDLFAPVSREYSQRIATMAVARATSAPMTMTMTAGMTTTMTAQMTMTMAPPPTGRVVTGADVPIRADGVISPYGPRREMIAVLELDPAFFDADRLGEGAIILERNSPIRNSGAGDGGDPSYVYFDTDERGIELRAIGNRDTITGHPGNANTRAIGRRIFAFRELRGFPSLPPRVTVSYRHDTRLNEDFYPDDRMTFSFYGFVNDVPTTVAVLTVTVQAHRTIRVDGNPLQGFVLGGAPPPLTVNEFNIRFGYGNISIELMQDGNVFEVAGRRIVSRTAIPAVAIEYPPVSMAIASLTVRISDDSRHSPDVLFTSAINGVSPVSASIVYTTPDTFQHNNLQWARMVSIYGLGGAGASGASFNVPAGIPRGYAMGAPDGHCSLANGTAAGSSIPWLQINFPIGTPAGETRVCRIIVNDAAPISGGVAGEWQQIAGTPAYEFNVTMTIPVIP